MVKIITLDAAPLQEPVPMKGNRTLCRTFSGHNFLFTSPRASDIKLLDVAHHLSQANRYNGACEFPYSVAQHSLLVAETLPPGYKLAGLFHDAAEALLGDIVRPLKNLLEDYKKTEDFFQGLVEDALHLESGALCNPVVVQADRMVMASEMDAEALRWRDILEYPLAPVEIREIGWKEMRASFLLSSLLLALPSEMQEICLEERRIPDSLALMDILTSPDFSIKPGRKAALAEGLDESLKICLGEHSEKVKLIHAPSSRGIESVIDQSLSCLAYSGHMRYFLEEQDNEPPSCT